jgi:hypothetical protein
LMSSLGSFVFSVIAHKRASTHAVIATGGTSIL